MKVNHNHFVEDDVTLRNSSDFDKGRRKGLEHCKGMLVKLARREKTKREVFRQIMKWLNKELSETKKKGCSVFVHGSYGERYTNPKLRSKGSE